MPFFDRSRSTADVIGRLEDLHVDAVLDEDSRCRQSRKTSTDHSNI